MLLSACLIFVYAGYQFFYGSIKAFIVSLVVMLIALVLAFRYHFWYFQIKQRKLGCTFNEWYRRINRGERNEEISSNSTSLFISWSWYLLMVH